MSEAGTNSQIMQARARAPMPESDLRSNCCDAPARRRLTSRTADQLPHYECTTCGRILFFVHWQGALYLCGNPSSHVVGYVKDAP
jgi:hypothetical protein